MHQEFMENTFCDSFFQSFYWIAYRRLPWAIWLGEGITESAGGGSVSDLTSQVVLNGYGKVSLKGT
jgi:hypothetical protein